ncbi:MAG: hemerythrin domain-containing protein [Marinilabiliaceae bacterium]|nr:hemerythrin domain-containing protein [Marinilabiliaceae bacterium]
MMVIHGDIKMADLIMGDINILAIIQRLNIPLGFKEKTVSEVCIEHNVDIQFFIQLTQSYRDKDYFPKDHFLTFPVEWIIDYLRNSHKCYVEHRIPTIEKQIIELENNIQNQNSSELLLRFFREYIQEFNTHIEIEEKIVFPYTIEINKSIKDNQLTTTLKKRYSNYHIEDYVEAHNNIEEKLYDLKNILIKYIPPPTTNCKYNTLIFDLFRLENDLKDHSDIEDKVLIPKVHLLEKKLKKLKMEDK